MEEPDRGHRLSDTVDQDLLRGIQVRYVLRGLGSLWRNSGGATAEEQDRDFAMSEPVSRIDDFISHDWLTGRWAKFFTLAYLYNTCLAVMLTMGLTLVVALMMVSEILPRPAHW